ncbi:potassium transporter peripheral membrane component [Symmachiella dynata]|uniref:Potassium transporter peripheral membrane component n=1 Tax=Symmachiella dynata TaxID=2527995 RepID=A0A517ZV80_9PLAN|nr:TrkA family potassium uptake protein [Symmachiella dynata]QDU46394.1 potassium transporter peripheral membrane component [Symmachiella dynata]
MKPLMRRGLANFYYLRRPLFRFSLLLLVAAGLVVVGGLCFHDYYRHQQMSYSEAFYTTYCLIFMEHIYEYPEHWLLQLYYWVLPPLGLAVILDGIVQFSYHLLRRDENSKEWMQAMAKTYNDHVILCGLGRVGFRILEELQHLGEHVIVLEKNADSTNIPYARKRGIPLFVGSGREEGILEELNLAAAKSIILATDDDLANLEMALDARKLNPDVRIVMRMFDQDLASKIREAFGIDLVFSTSAVAAPLFATASTDRSITNSFYVDGKLLVVAEVDVADNSTLVGRDIRTLRRKHDIYVITCKRAGRSDFYPEGDLKLAVADRITIQTEPAMLKQIHRWNGGEVVH